MENESKNEKKLKINQKYEKSGKSIIKYFSSESKCQKSFYINYKTVAVENRILINLHLLVDYIFLKTKNLTYTHELSAKQEHSPAKIPGQFKVAYPS